MQPYNGESVDVFSTGVVLFAMISGKYPFSKATNDDSRYKMIMNKEFKQFWQGIDKGGLFSTTCRDLIE